MQKPSLKLRTIAAVACLLLLFATIVSLMLFKGYQKSVYRSESARLQSDVATLLSLTRSRGGALVMPERTPNDTYSELDSELLGMVLDSNLRPLWQTLGAKKQNIQPDAIRLPEAIRTSKRLSGILSIQQQDYFYFALKYSSTDLAQEYYFLALNSKQDFDRKITRFWVLVLWLAMVLMALATLATFCILWGLRPLKRINRELAELETGSRQRLSSRHPKEIRGITNEFNQLLDRERKQKERYRNTLSDLAHSLKTPVAVLKLLLERAPGAQDSTDRQTFIQAGKDQLQQMSAIIQYQLKRAIIDGGKPMGKPLFQPQPLLHRLCANLAKIQDDRLIHWHLECDERLALAINRHDFLECTGNLLENAFRLASATVHVRLTLDRSMKHQPLMRLAVEDDGPGVADQFKEWILQRGARIDCASPGHGLGLAIVKDIIDDHDGQIDVQDSPLGGALFVIYWPLSACHLQVTASG